MRNPHGYLTVVGERESFERDTITCGHCNKVVLVKPGTASTVYLIPRPDGSWIEEAGAGCSVCGSPVCLPCHDDGLCLPIEKRLEIMEAEAKILGAHRRRIMKWRIAYKVGSDRLEMDVHAPDRESAEAHVKRVGDPSGAAAPKIVAVAQVK